MGQLPPEGQLARWDGSQWVPVQTPVQQAPVPATPAGPKPLLSRWWVWAVAIVLALATIGSLNGRTSAVAPVAAISPSSAVSATPSEATTETPTPTVTTTTSAPKPKPKPRPKTYRALTSRKFKLLAKDPDAYIGDTFVVHGEITQFDSATGTDTFRANTGPAKLRISYGYTTYRQNTILAGSKARLKKLVEGDCFTAKVTVLGSYSYDTQAGGNTTVPSLYVDSIKVYGSTD